MDAFQAVQSVIHEDFGSQIPAILDHAVDLIGKAHLYYRTYKQILILDRANRDPAQENPAIYGAALDLLADYTSIGFYAVNVALITKCAEDLLREYRQLKNDYLLFYQAITWQYPIYRSIAWQCGKTEVQFSPSFHLFWQTQVMGLINQILRITCYALLVLKQTFKLSMVLCDARLLLKHDPQARLEACTELISDWRKYQTQLKEEQRRLLEEIEKGSLLADRILQHMGLTRNSAYIISGLKNRVEVFAQDVKESLDDLYEVGEETVDTFYVKGKITPLHIDLSEGKAAPSPIPRGRFPPWAGQEVKVISPKSDTAALQLKKVFSLTKTEFSIEKSFNGMNKLTEIDQYRMELPSLSPFN